MSSPSPSPAANPESGGGRRSASRSSSFGLLRRSKSKDPLGERKTSGNRLGRKKSRIDQEEEARKQREEAEAAAKKALVLPSLAPQPQIQTFGGDTYEPRMASNGVSDIPPVPPLPDFIDPYARTESMTHRGRYSYASSLVSTLNGPRRVRRRKDPTPYNVLIIGARNSGKTSFLNFLKTSLQLPPKKRPIRDPEADTPPPSARANRNYIHHYQETEIDSERIGLTIWDSQGLEKSIVDLQLREMSTFVESKFEDTFIEEMKVIRAPGVRDTHIHCVFLILDPVRLDANIQAAQQSMSNGSSSRHSKAPRIVGGLDEDFDLQVLRTLQGKTTVVPVISKADTVTSAHMSFLKKTVRESLKKAGLDPLEALNYEADNEDEDDMDKIVEGDEDEAEKKEESDDSPGTPKTDDSDTVPDGQPTPGVKRRMSNKRQSSNFQPSTSMLDRGYVPLSILSPDSFSLTSNEGPIGRKFPWGFADPYNPEHCDFVKLKDATFGEWRAELREASRDVFYERWRTNRLQRQGQSANGQGGGGRNTQEARKTWSGMPQSLPKVRAQ